MQDTSTYMGILRYLIFSCKSSCKSQFILKFTSQNFMNLFLPVSNMEKHWNPTSKFSGNTLNFHEFQSMTNVWRGNIFSAGTL